MSGNFWDRDAYRFAVWACCAFLVLTTVAMLLYPGGTFVVRGTEGYSFTHNFFSDLGMVRAWNRQPNAPSMLLFVAALFFASIGLALFFVAFTRFFAPSASGRWLARIGAVFGLGTSICFAGAAAVPADVAFAWHFQFQLWAFRLFLVTAILLAIAVLRTRALPRRFAAVFVAFAAVLVGFILLVTFGPSITTRSGEAVQAIGQKVVVYSALIAVLAQAGMVLKRRDYPPA